MADRKDRWGAMSQEYPTQAEVIEAIQGPEGVEVDDPEYLASLNIDCLGCLYGALAAGSVSQEQYDAILEMFSEIERQGKITCTQCGGIAYISQYEPSMTHCSECGAYLVRSESDGAWEFYWFYWRGPTHRDTQTHDHASSVAGKAGE
jgi:hypothetical protein